MHNEFDDEILLLIKRKFLSCIPLVDIELETYLKNITWSQQSILLQQTINNELVIKYPIKLSYQRAFLKRVIDILETNNNNCEVHDHLYESYCYLLQTADKQQVFKHYCIGDAVVTLNERNSFVSDGTTGLCSWQSFKFEVTPLIAVIQKWVIIWHSPDLGGIEYFKKLLKKWDAVVYEDTTQSLRREKAAYALSEWCLNNLELFKNRIILELGSGVGLLGIIIALYCEANTIYLTDCHPKVLEVLNSNIHLNCNKTSVNKIDIKNKDLKTHTPNNLENEPNLVPYLNDLKSIESECSKIDLNSDLNTYFVKQTKICVGNLRWESVNELDWHSLLTVDWLLAADVIYDSSCFSALVNVLKYIFKSNLNCRVLFSCTERNSETLQQFLRLLEQNLWCIEEIPCPKASHFFWSTQLPIRFIIVTSS